MATAGAPVAVGRVGEPEVAPECALSCWCRNDDPDPEGGMRWEPAAGEGR